MKKMQTKTRFTHRL